MRLIEETLPDGRIIGRDQEGKIRKSSLPPAVAREMGAIGKERRFSNAQTVQALLFEAGYDDDNPPPNHLKVLAELACSNHNALRDFRRLTSQEPEEQVYQEHNVHILISGSLARIDGDFYVRWGNPGQEEFSALLKKLDQHRYEQLEAERKRIDEPGVV